MTDKPPVVGPPGIQFSSGTTQEVIQREASEAGQQIGREQAQQLVHAFGTSVSFTPPVQFSDKVAEKLTDAHVTTIISQIGEDGLRTYSLNREKLWGHLGIAAIAIVAFLLLCWLFLSYEKGDLLKEVLVAFIGFAGGFGIGKLSPAKQK